MSRHWNRRLAVAVLVASGLVFTACGGGGGGSGATRTAVDGKIEVNAFDPYRFDVKTIKASPGPLTVTLRERGATQHTFTISELDFEIVVTSDNKVATGTVTLEAGKTYQFKCSYDGHAAAGMVGTIVVG